MTYCRIYTPSLHSASVYRCEALSNLESRKNHPSASMSSRNRKTLIHCSAYYSVVYCGSMAFWIICSCSSVQKLTQLLWTLSLCPDFLTQCGSKIAHHLLQLQFKWVWWVLNYSEKAVDVCTFSIRFSKIMIISGIVSLDTRGIWTVKIKSWLDFSILNYYWIMPLLKNSKLQYDISVLQWNAVQKQFK